MSEAPPYAEYHWLFVPKRQPEFLLREQRDTPSAPDGHRWFPKLRYSTRASGKGRIPTMWCRECFSCNQPQNLHHPNAKTEKERKAYEDAVKMHEDWWVT